MTLLISVLTCSNTSFSFINWDQLLSLNCSAKDIHWTFFLSSTTNRLLREGTSLSFMSALKRQYLYPALLNDFLLFNLLSRVIVLQIYCGKLPKDLFEDSLIPLFENIGAIWDLRLMMDPISGRNRGYCFVTFTEKKAAEEAVKQVKKTFFSL